GYGTWVTFGQQVDEVAAARIIDTAFELGINFIDTADVYARGRAESMLGNLLASRTRSDYVLATKVFGGMGEGPNDRGLSRKHIIEACEASLRRLRTDYVDLYQCHRYDIDVPLDEVLAAMDHLVEQGKVLHWGVSQWPAVQIAEAVLTARHHGWAPPASNQPLYNLVERGLELDVMRTCERHGLGIVCFSPLAQGILTGKYGGGERPPGSRAADPTTGQWMERRMTPELLDRAQRMAAVAARLGVSPAQLALAWCLRHDAVTSVIVGATTPEQLRDNAGAADITLDAEVLEELEELFESAPRDQYTGQLCGYGHERWGF
ncbi:MAG: aldo/keto reductase family protein, partial [Candidatus Eiseniibacteriota bacterium]